MSVLVDLEIGSYQVLPLQMRVNLGAMAIKGYSAFPKAQHYWSLTIRLINVISRTLIWWGGGGSYPSAEMQLVYSTAPVCHDLWQIKLFEIELFNHLTCEQTTNVLLNC